jgi:hypothetical protein
MDYSWLTQQHFTQINSPDFKTYVANHIKDKLAIPDIPHTCKMALIYDFATNYNNHVSIPLSVHDFEYLRSQTRFVRIQLTWMPKGINKQCGLNVVRKTKFADPGIIFLISIYDLGEVQIDAVVDGNDIESRDIAIMKASIGLMDVIGG